MSLDIPAVCERPCHEHESVAISLEESSETEIGSPSFMTSRLLCPSNLGALLESTTATLVSGGWKESSDDTNRDCEVSLSQSEKEQEGDQNMSNMTQEQ